MGNCLNKSKDQVQDHEITAEKEDKEQSQGIENPKKLHFSQETAQFNNGTFGTGEVKVEQCPPGYSIKNGNMSRLTP